MNVRQITLAHELDAAWIIALWKMIHGGDPAPETVAVEVVTAMTPFLKGAANSLTFQQLEKQFNNIGVQVTDSEAAGAHVEELSVPHPRQYCFKFKGQTICIQLPLPRAVKAAV